MATPSLLAQIFARDPRRLVRFPEAPIDQALAELQTLQETLATAANAAATAASSGASVAETAPDGLMPALSALATHVWRAKNKLVEPETGQPREEAKRVYRHIEGALETFAQIGLTLNDWMNQPYDAGLPLKVLSFQPTPGIQRDTVLEVVKPTVIWKDTLLQLGEVVVGVPVNSENTPS